MFIVIIARPQQGRIFIAIRRRDIRPRRGRTRLLRHVFINIQPRRGCEGRREIRPYDVRFIIHHSSINH